MKTKDIRDLVWFNEDEARTETLFETDHLWSQVICLQNNQGIGPLSDPTLRCAGHRAGGRGGSPGRPGAGPHGAVGDDRRARRHRAHPAQRLGGADGRDADAGAAPGPGI